jgi:hypothetical protein
MPATLLKLAAPIAKADSGSADGSAKKVAKKALVKKDKAEKSKPKARCADCVARR